MHALIDSHAHLDAPEFDHDRAQILERAHAAGVRDFVVPAVAFAGFEKLKDLSAAHGWQPAYGLHPMYLADHRPEHLTALRSWLKLGCAVGECGLDFLVPDLDVEQQRFYFHKQIELALEFDLPLILHARRAVEEVLQTLKRFRPKGGVVHSFAGSREQADALWSLNFAIGIGGPLTYPRAKRLHEIVRHAALESLLLETDAPDQPLSGHQGARNEPAMLPNVLQAVAEARQADPADIARATTANTRRLFYGRSNPL